jgi:hypothetical protein
VKVPTKKGRKKVRPHKKRQKKSSSPQKKAEKKFGGESPHHFSLFDLPQPWHEGHQVPTSGSFFESVEHKCHSESYHGVQKRDITFSLTMATVTHLV